MPLNTMVKRGDKVRKDLTWSGWDGMYTLNYFLTVALREGDPELVITADGQKAGELSDDDIVDIANTGVYYLETKAPLWKVGEQTLENDHTIELRDGFTIAFKKGDVLKMWRN